MNKCLYFLLFSFIVVACNDADDHAPEIPTVSVWETSHSAMMGLKGNVGRVVETATDPFDESSEEMKLSEYRFNTSGRLVYYNPTGVELEAAPRWIGFASFYYAYEYDGSGRIAKVTVSELGDNTPRSYLLTYSDHPYYIPLTFPVGPMNFFLVKGLESIKNEDGTFHYHFDGTKASYSESAWNGVKEVAYEYQSDSFYPVRQIMTEKRKEQLLKAETVAYSFAPNGTLLRMDRLVTGGSSDEVLEHTVTDYMKDGLLLISRIKTEDADNVIEWEYTYGSDNLLRGIMCKHKGDYIDEEETYNYQALDNAGNWTLSRQELNSMIVWDHPNGGMNIHRTFTYQ